MPIEIKVVKTISECEAIMHISAAAWGSDLDDVVPSHAMLAIAKNNGVVLMAWDEDKPVGFCFSFLAFDGDTVDDDTTQFKHYSHQAGILPAYKGQQLGERLKWAQREQVLAQDVSRITWTFDPLQTLNAKLNIHKLGAVCSTYTRNCYGKMEDALNKGIPTDRFEVDWWLASDWVEAHETKRAVHPAIDALDGVVLNTFRLNGELAQPKSIDYSLERPFALINVPRNYQQIIEQDNGLAVAWRLHTRELFEQAFGAGYTAVDLIVQPTHCTYVLQKNWHPNP